MDNKETYKYVNKYAMEEYYSFYEANIWFP